MRPRIDTNLPRYFGARSFRQILSLAARLMTPTLSSCFFLFLKSMVCSLVSGYIKYF
jgi:hypothetical protein